MKINFDQIYDKFIGAQIPAIHQISFDQNLGGGWRCLISTHEGCMGVGGGRTKPKAFLAALSNLITGESSEIIEGPFDVDPPQKVPRKFLSFNPDSPEGTIVVYGNDGGKYEYKLKTGE